MMRVVSGWQQATSVAASKMNYSGGGWYKNACRHSPRAKAKAIKYKLATHPPTRRAAVVVGRVERNAGKGPFTRTLRAAALRCVVQT